jgi:hypothetical protein
VNDSHVPHDPRRNGRNRHDAPDGEIDLRVAHPDDQLSALLDGELDAATAAEVRRHVDGCEPCRVELDEVADVRRALRDMPAVPAPPGFVGRLVEQRRRATRRGATVTLLAAALALVIGIAAADGPDTVVGSDQPSEQVAAEKSATGPRLQRWDAGRPDPDVKLSLPARHDPPAGGGDDSVLERAHEVGRDLLESLGG